MHVVVVGNEDDDDGDEGTVFDTSVEEELEGVSENAVNGCNRESYTYPPQLTNSGWQPMPQ